MKHPELIQALTLKQKVALLSGRDIWSTYPIPQQDIPAMYLSDGPHGVRKQLGASDHLGLNASQPATCFPTAAGVANSWNPDLAEEIGRAIGKEAACQQVNVLLGPGLNTKRNPLGGRNFEYYSEDPYLSGKMAAALIRGIQENGISACPKHFAANSQELLRMASDSVVDMRALRELYLTNFEIAVKEGHPKSIMSSYNRINGTYANDDAWLLTDVLRKEWGFDGFVVTDWGGSNDHAQAVRAGGNLEMPGTGGDSDREIFAALESGTLTEAEVDQRVDELLDVVLSTHAATGDGPKEFDVEAHHALARKAAAETAVLLKNEEDILPLAPGTRVAVLGDMALEPRYQGAGSSVVNPTKLDKPIDCLRACDLEITGQAQGYRRDGKEDQALLDSAVSAARNADVVLLYLGLTEISESEGMDRQHMRLPANQEKLLYAVAEANPNLVVVVSGGSAVELPWVDQCKGLIHGYLSGQAGAGAIADLLTGAVNPSGKLAESFPICYEDTPNHTYFPGRQRTAEYRESIYVGYRYYETVGKAVRFPFGFGLSYTTFAYSDLKASRDAVSFTLTNTGKCAGGEIAQVYLSAVNSGIFRPARELKGFAKVFLEPGESRTVTIPLDDKAFRYFNVKTNSWEVEGGEYSVQVGASVQDIRLTASLTVEGTGAPLPYDSKELPSYFSGHVETVGSQEFEALLGRPLPESHWDPKAPLGWNDALLRLPDARNPLARLAGKIIVGKMEKSLAGRSADLNILFVCNMPFRGIAKMTGGMATEKTARSILLIVNGHFFRGLGGVIRGLRDGRKLKHERRNGI
ncbi:glycosyl hydrolase [Pseudoflavonifractor sp. AF19-9AC]|uniref:glycoside hydrolase family 3 C-terminal domain-containing protein n=1 Tax=Pseudoflavonifractor sp. AF19-9AC TaxID=2292244 RepID=UPI000E4703D5|nr:glycoside hydrolase family 3 C-terminal domain-containing protein [Pseudoflavonifractor sp. AF19-9AC]RHR10966.1 glycosyl hydrolase [Pseudoflavonifractor sp. AF19-9AC]